MIKLEYIINDRDDYRNSIYTLNIIANNCIDTTYIVRKSKKV